MSTYGNIVFVVFESHRRTWRNGWWSRWALEVHHNGTVQTIANGRIKVPIPIRYSRIENLTTEHPAA